MSARLRRRAAAVAVPVLLGALTASLLGTPVPALAATPDAQGGAVQQFGACLTARRSGDLLVLLDQSASLRTTDPGDVRVQAASFLVGQLERTTQQAGIALDVAVAGFDRDYQRTVDWQRLDDASLPGVLTGVEQYRDRDGGIDTDYAQALSGARDDLRSRQRDSTDQRCQVVVWFSDGQFDLEVRDTDQEVQRYGSEKPYAPGVSLTSPAGAQQAEDAGRQALCREGGIADQLRASDALTFAVGLGDDVDFGLMTSVATGSGGAAPCGRPPEQPVGDFRLARNVGDLVFAINAYTGLVPPVDTETAVCVQAACPEGTRQFVLDASISRVDVVAGSSESGVDLVLSPPDDSPPARFAYTQVGQPVDVTVGGQRARAVWLSDRQLQLDLDHVTDVGWTGQWTLVPVAAGSTPPGARARTQIRITGDLVPRLDEPQPELSAGPQTLVRVGLAREQNGAAVPVEAVLGTARVSATLVAADGTSVPVLADSDLRQASEGVAADLSEVPLGAAVLQLRLAVQTAGTTANGVAVPGTQLADRQVDVPVRVVPPPGRGRLLQDRVDFGRTEGTGPTAAALRVAGPGCFWLSSASVATGPEGVRPAVSSPSSAAEDCLRLAEGEQGDLPLQLALDTGGNGTVTGLLDLRIAPLDGAGEPATASVAYAGDVVRPVKKPVLYGVFAAALLLGLLVPLLLLYLLKHLTARIPSGRGLRVASVPVELVGDEVRRDGAPLTLTLQDTRFLGIPGRGVRRLDVDDVQLLTRAGWSPAGAAYTQVVAAGRTVVTSEGGSRLPLGVHGTWSALLAPPDLSRGTLLVLLPADAPVDQYDRVARDVRDRLPALAVRARADAGAPPPPAPTPAGAWGAPPAPAAGQGWVAPSPAAPTGGWGSPSATPGGASTSSPSPPPSASPPSPGGWEAPPPPGSWGTPPPPRS